METPDAQVNAMMAQGLTPEDVDLDSYLEKHEDGTATLTLAYPYTVKEAIDGGPKQDREVDTLHFRRPKAGYLDILAAASSDVAAVRASREVIAKMTGTQPKHIADLLDVEDYMRAAVVLDLFFPKPKPPKTGASLPET